MLLLVCAAKLSLAAIETFGTGPVHFVGGCLCYCCLSFTVQHPRRSALAVQFGGDAAKHSLLPYSNRDLR